MYTLDQISPNNLPLEFVKDYLRVDYDDDDIELGVMIKSAQDYIKKYVKASDTDILDYQLMIPLLSLISYCYENKTTVLPKANVISSIFTGSLELSRGSIL